MSSETPAPPQVGNYRVLYQLASGGTSSVYVGERLQAEDLVALKLLDKIDRGERGMLTFQAEARVTASLTHKNVVRTLEWGEHEGIPFLVMELLLGASLSEVLAAQKRHDRQLDPWLAGFIVEQAALGLHHAHELRDGAGNPVHLVHRDISPQNILLSFEGRVALSDFGIAKFSNRGMTTARGLLKGRFAYMSPEHARGETLDRRSDIFSLGIVLFEALTLERAFDGKSAGDAILQLLHMKRLDPGALRADVPSALSEVVAKACASDPAQRFGSAAEMAQALLLARQAAGADAPDAALGSLIGEHFQQRQIHLQHTLDNMERPALPMAPAPLTGSVPPARALPWALLALAGLAVCLVVATVLLFALR